MPCASPGWSAPTSKASSRAPSKSSPPRPISMPWPAATRRAAAAPWPRLQPRRAALCHLLGDRCGRPDHLCRRARGRPGTDAADRGLVQACCSRARISRWAASRSAAAPAGRACMSHMPLRADRHGRDGAVIAALDLEWLSRRLADVPLPPGGVVFLSDRAGTCSAAGRSPARFVVAARRRPRHHAGAAASRITECDPRDRHRRGAAQLRPDADQPAAFRHLCRYRARIPRRPRPRWPRARRQRAAADPAPAPWRRCCSGCSSPRAPWNGRSRPCSRRWNAGAPAMPAPASVATRGSASPAAAANSCGSPPPSTKPRKRSRRAGWRCAEQVALPADRRGDRRGPVHRRARPAPDDLRQSGGGAALRPARRPIRRIPRSGAAGPPRHGGAALSRPPARASTSSTATRHPDGTERRLAPSPLPRCMARRPAGWSAWSAT